MGGPVAAALGSLAALGLAMDAEFWSGIADALRAAGARPITPWLNRRACSYGAARSGGRSHGDGRHLLTCAGPKRVTGKLLRTGRLAPDAAGALRVVLASGVITERVARR